MKRPEGNGPGAHLLPAAPLSRIQPAAIGIPPGTGIPHNQPAITRRNPPQLKIVSVPEVPFGGTQKIRTEHRPNHDPGRARSTGR
jgi:hypothetical protein